MVELLISLHNKLKNKEITESQALYLIFLEAELSYSIDQKEQLELAKKKYIRGDKVTRKVKIIYSKKDTAVKGSISPKYMNEASKNVVFKLCKLFCVVNEKGELKVPGSGENDPILFTAEHYLKGEGLVARHFLIFLFLFPIKGKVNRKWEKHFTGSLYTGAALRRRSVQSAKLFKDLARKLDMGAILYGTYLYMKSTVQGNKSFVTTIPKFLKTDFMDWYLEAHAILKENPDIERMFRRDSKGSSDTLQRMI